MSDYLALSFCGKRGPAERAGNNLLVVTCRQCAKATDPDPARYPAPQMPFTLGKSKTVHGGRLIERAMAEHFLVTLEVDARQALFSGERATAVKELVDAELAEIKLWLVTE